MKVNIWHLEMNGGERETETETERVRGREEGKREIRDKLTFLINSVPPHLVHAPDSQISSQFKCYLHNNGCKLA